jgi:dienelactone hydrolase
MSNSVRIIIVLLLTALTPSTIAADTDNGLDLPEPTGCHAVGTRVGVLRDMQRSRELLVTLWYPADNGNPPTAPYMDKETAAAVAEKWKLLAGFERQVRTHSRLLAPVTHGAFPIILLEHGSEVVPAIYTVLAEDLASNGFIVAATNHPPDSLIAVFQDGHQVRFKPYWPEDADRRTQGVAIGKFAEDVLVRDVRFVLDQLQEMNLHDSFWRGHMDLSKIGIVGHSMGGTTATLATKEESRILAGVNLDGSTYPGMNADVRPIELRKPLLFVATEEHASNPETRAREYVGSRSNTYYVTLVGADHMSFTDANLLDSRFSRDSRANESAFQSALLTLELSRSLVEEFFAKYLQHRPAPNLDSIVHIEKK